MISSKLGRSLRRLSSSTAVRVLAGTNDNVGASNSARFLSSSLERKNKANQQQARNHSYAFDENGETTGGASEKIAFPTANPNDPDEMEYQPILLNSKEHAVGYLSRILNARVYEAAIETELQHAKNLSAVSAKKSNKWMGST